MTRTNRQALIERALAEPADSDSRWTHVKSLHRLGDEETFMAAVELCRSDEPARRTLGVDILGQLGAGKLEERPYRAPAVEVLLEALTREGDPSVLQSIGAAFGHLKDPRCIPALHKLRHHPDEDVRHSVVFGLLGHDYDLAVDTLVELSSDPDEDVRDWATFGLGTELDRDTEQVREALLARVEDPHQETRAEALKGLSARADERAVEPMLAELQGSPGRLVEEALFELAARTGDERLCPEVLARQDWASGFPDIPPPEHLETAVSRCRHAFAPPTRLSRRSHSSRA